MYLVYQAYPTLKPVDFIVFLAYFKLTHPNHITRKMNELHHKEKKTIILNPLRNTTQSKCNQDLTLHREVCH